MDGPDEATVRAGAMDALLGRLQHELATPLLTAAGFGRIVLEAVDEEVRPELRRCLDGIDRAREVLGRATELAEEGTLGVVDVVSCFTAAASEEAPAMALRVPDRPVLVHGDPEVVTRLVTDVVRLVRERARSAGTDEAPSVEVEVGSARASTLVLTVVGGPGPWPAAVREVVDGVGVSTSPAPAEEDRDAGTAEDEPTVAARAAALAASQLGSLWLDEDADPARLTLRLLRADPALLDATDPVTDDGSGG